MKSCKQSPIIIIDLPQDMLLRNRVSPIDNQQIVRLITSLYFTLMISETYHEGNVIDFNVVQRPSSEEFDFRHRFSHPWIYVSSTGRGDKNQSINHHLTALPLCQAGDMHQPHKKPQAILWTQKILKSQI
jgi:hypothetical protein